MATVIPMATLDRRGKTITTFVVFDVRAELGNIEVGDVVEVLTDDFEPFRHDIAAWCELAGHRVVASESTAEGLRFLIEKGSPKAVDGSLAVVISSDGLLELLSPLAFGLAAALEGMAVDIYVQGPAVRVLARGFRPKLHGWARPFTHFAASGLNRAGHVAAQDKLRQLHSLGAKIYVCGPSMQRFKVDAESLILDGLPIVEYLTFMAIMNEAHVHIYA